METQHSNDSRLLDKELSDTLPVFEKFLQGLGLKRIDGMVYGLLVLAPRSMTSEEIERNLGLSQSAVSQSLKTLSGYGAIETREARGGRSKVHHAVTDSLQIAATIFKRREAIMIGDFKRQCEKILNTLAQSGVQPQDLQMVRMRSIIMTCQLAESVMSFVIAMTDRDLQRYYPVIIQRFKFLTEKMTSGAETIERWSEQIEQAGMEGISHITDRLKGKIGKWAQHLSRENIQ